MGGANAHSGAGDRIRSARFGTAVRGYRRSDVRTLLLRVADELDAGRRPESLISDAELHQGFGGYRRDEVDRVLDELVESWRPPRPELTGGRREVTAGGPRNRRMSRLRLGAYLLVVLVVVIFTTIQHGSHPTSTGGATRATDDAGPSYVPQSPGANTDGCSLTLGEWLIVGYYDPGDAGYRRVLAKGSPVASWLRAHTGMLATTNDQTVPPGLATAADQECQRLDAEGIDTTTLPEPPSPPG